MPPAGSTVAASSQVRRHRPSDGIHGRADGVDGRTGRTRPPRRRARPATPARRWRARRPRRHPGRHREPRRRGTPRRWREARCAGPRAAPPPRCRGGPATPAPPAGPARSCRRRRAAMRATVAVRRSEVTPPGVRPCRLGSHGRGARGQDGPHDQRRVGRAARPRARCSATSTRRPRPCGCAPRHPPGSPSSAPAAPGAPPTVAVHGSHYALVVLDGLLPGQRRRPTPCASTTCPVWPRPGMPPSRIRTLDPNR